MIKRGVLVAAWLMVGHTILGVLYWLLLQIPESNVFMLTASLLVVMVMLAWAGAVQASALLGWVPGTGAAAALVQGARRAAWFVLPLVLFILVWLLTGFTQNWMEAHGSEFDAWFIATFGWTDASAFHTAVAWVLWFVRYGIGISLAVAFFAALLMGRRVGASAVAWVGRGFSWRAMGLTALVLWAGVWVPWRYVADWRPASLPASWVQPAFASVKLFVLFVVMNVAWTVVLWWGAKQAAPVAVTPAGPVAVAAPAPMVPDQPATSEPLFNQADPPTTT